MTKDDQELRLIEAERWWDLRQKGFEYSKDYGSATIRSMILINGGAVVAVIAAISNIASKNESLALKLAAALTPSLGIFLLGLILSVLAGCTAYFNFALGMGSMPGPNELVRYVATGDISGWQNRSRAIKWTMYVSVTFVFASILSFITAAVAAMSALSGNVPLA